MVDSSFFLVRVHRSDCQNATEPDRKCSYIYFQKDLSPNFSISSKSVCSNTIQLYYTPLVFNFHIQTYIQTWHLSHHRLRLYGRIASTVSAIGECNCNIEVVLYEEDGEYLRVSSSAKCDSCVLYSKQITSVLISINSQKLWRCLDCMFLVEIMQFIVCLR